MIRWLILVAIVVGATVAAYAGGRDWRMTNMPRVAKVGDLPPGSDFAKYERFVSYGGFLPKQRTEPLPYMPTRVPDLEEPGPVALGHSFREFSALGLPLWTSEDMGFVMYREGTNGYMVFPLNQPRLELLGKETGKRVEQGYAFPFWQYAWGWLFAIAIVIWLIFKFRDEHRRRLESGII